MSQLGLAFDEKLCIACYGCKVACKANRDIPLGLDWCRLEKKWVGRGIDTRLVYFAVPCQQCVNPACVASCPAGALSKGADGMVTVDSGKCIACKACLDACPFNVPQFPEGGKMGKCDLCKGLFDPATETPPCVSTCPSAALTLTQMSVDEKNAQEARYKKFMDLPKYEL